MTRALKLLTGSLACSVLALGPWWGGAPHAFRVPGTEIALPGVELGLLRPAAAGLYRLATVPVELLALAVPGRLLHFSGEGPRRVRPFFVSALWALAAAGLSVTAWHQRAREREEPRSTRLVAYGTIAVLSGVFDVWLHGHLSGLGPVPVPADSYFVSMTTAKFLLLWAAHETLRDHARTPPAPAAPG